MEEAQLLQQLEALAVDLGVEIRYDDLEESRGGLCRCRDRTYLVVDHHLSLPQRVQLLSCELSRLCLDDVFLRPDLRELLESRACGPAGWRAGSRAQPCSGRAFRRASG